MPSAAEPARPASRTSSAAVGAAGGLRHPGPDCSAAAGAGGGRLHTTPAGSSHCSPAAAGCWPPPAAGPERAAGTDGGNQLKKPFSQKESSIKLITSSNIIIGSINNPVH